MRDNLASRLHNNTKRPTPASTQRPEQVSVLASVRYAQLTVGCHNSELKNSVDAESVYVGKDGVATTLDRRLS